MFKLFNTAKSAIGVALGGIYSLSSMLLRLSVNQPLLVQALLFSSMLQPILGREIRRYYWTFECGTFSTDKVNLSGTPIGVPLNLDGQTCFFPSGLNRYASDDTGILFCRIGDGTREFFEQHQVSDDEMKIFAHGNPGVTVCEEYERIMSESFFVLKGELVDSDDSDYSTNMFSV